MNYISTPMMIELRGNVFIALHRLYQKGYVKAEKQTGTGALSDFMSNAEGRQNEYHTSAASSTSSTTSSSSTIGASTFTLVTQSAVKK
jgi:predicted transcriptional regulator